jgi:hypothetical protein
MYHYSAYVNNMGVKKKEAKEFYRIAFRRHPYKESGVEGPVTQAYTH